MKLKDTKLGIFLKDKAPNILNIAGDLLPDAGVLGIVKNLISSSDIPKEQKLEFERLVKEFEQKELEAILQDKQNARQLQITALQQDDKFSKRFIYYLAIGIIIYAFIFDICMFFVSYPNANRDMINQVSGVVNSGAFMSIVYFFYGGSKGSSEKNDIIKNLTK